jgi:ATP-binding cassette subfamily B protein
MKQHFSDYPPLDPKKVVSSKNGLTALWRLMSGYHGHYLLAALMLAISATARAGIYLFLGWFVDHILKEGRFGSELLLSAAGFMGLILMQAVSGFLSNQLAAQTAESSTRRLRDLLFDHIQRLSFAYHAKRKPAICSNALLQMWILCAVLSATRLLAWRGLSPFFIINFTAILQLNTRLAFVSVIIVPVILVVSILFFRKLSKAYEAYQEQEAVISTTCRRTSAGYGW